MISEPTMTPTLGTFDEHFCDGSGALYKIHESSLGSFQVRKHVVEKFPDLPDIDAPRVSRHEKEMHDALGFSPHRRLILRYLPGEAVPSFITPVLRQSYHMKRRCLSVNHYRSSWRAHWVLV